MDLRGTEAHARLDLDAQHAVAERLREHNLGFGFGAVHSEHQKRPNVHEIVLSIKLRSPPPGKKCQF